MESTVGGISLVEVKIQRVIFQGDALSPIIFVIAMISLNLILMYFAQVDTNLLNRKKRSITWTTLYCLPKMKKNWKQTVRIYTQDIGIKNLA